MIENYRRLCDVCRKNIICDQYSKVRIPAGYVEVLWAGLPRDGRPTWKAEADGSVTVELCDACVQKMNDLA